MASLAFFDDFSDFSIQKALAIMYPHDKTRDKNSTEKAVLDLKRLPFWWVLAHSIENNTWILVKKNESVVGQIKKHMKAK